MTHFALHDYYKDHVHSCLCCPPFNSKMIFSSFISGAFTAITILFISYPIMFARVRLAVDVGSTSKDREFLGLIDFSKKMINSNSAPLNFYKGILP